MLRAFMDQPQPAPTPSAPQAPSPPAGLWPGLALALTWGLVGMALAKAPGLAVLGPLTLAMGLGLAWRAVAGLSKPFVPGSKMASRTVLRAGIVLLGARLDLVAVAGAGPKLLALALGVIAFGLVVIPPLARRCGASAPLALLIAVGTSICGASAVAAAAPLAKANEEEVALALALCGLLGTVGVLLYIPLLPALGFSLSASGMISGATLHEVAQATAAAGAFGPAALELGTLTKLSRVVLLAPALLLLGLIGGSGSGRSWSWKEPPIPYFVLGFLALGAVGSTGVMAPWVKDALGQASVGCMAVAMAAMGLNTPFDLLKKAGKPVLAAGILGFVALAVPGILAVAWMGTP